MPKSPNQKKRNSLFSAGNAPNLFTYSGVKKAELLKSEFFNSSEIPVYDSTGTVFYI